MPRYIDANKLKEHYSWWQNENKTIFDTIIDLQPEVSDLISKSALMNKIATECHYATENPLEQYAKLISIINGMEAVKDA